MPLPVKVFAVDVSVLAFGLGLGFVAGAVTGILGILVVAWMGPPYFPLSR
jgi:hypothetical protein